MVWSEQIFRYCERGVDPSFWAEPVNAATNLGFIFVGVLAALHYFRRAPERRAVPEVALIALVFVIGIGSFLFHTFATRWASLADIIPITVFMLAYFGYALRTFIGLGWFAVSIGVVAFVGALYCAGEVSCSPGFTTVANARGAPCLNGTAGYIPALLAVLGIGGVLWLRCHSAWRYLACAGLVFFVSMVFRAIDFEICDGTMLISARIGSHFLWHLLNATVLYLLLRAALFHGRTPTLA